MKQKVLSRNQLHLLHGIKKSFFGKRKIEKLYKKQFQFQPGFYTGYASIRYENR